MDWTYILRKHIYRDNIYIEKTYIQKKLRKDMYIYKMINL